MLYFLYGSDIHTSKKKLNTLIARLRERRAGAELFVLESKEITTGILEELITSKGLFEEKYIVVLNRAFESAGAKEVVIQHSEAMRSSDNVFLLHEGSVDAPSARAIQKHADDTQVFEERERKRAGRDTTLFSLADAVGKRNRKEAWVRYHGALLRGNAVEEIHGILFWQIKSILLAGYDRTPQASGLSPFVFNKARRYTENYSEGELKLLSTQLVSAYHDARRGIHTLEYALEQLLLTL